MAYLKLQAMTSLEIAPSDDCLIPVPTSPHFSGTGIVGTGVPVTQLVGDTFIAGGTASASSGSIQGVNINAGIYLNEAGQTFETDGVQPGDIFMNTNAAKVDAQGNPVESKVKFVISETELTIEAEPFAPLTNPLK